MSAATPGVASPAPDSPPGRIVSMDQYRGYAVIGMFIVNFLGHFQVTHHFLKHNNTHFSWADSIMPTFIFAAGFSFRLSILKRVPKIGRRAAYTSIIRRSFALVLVSLIMYTCGNKFKTWAVIDADSIWTFIAMTLKADLWETLAIIGVSQLLVLPFIELSTKARLLTTIAFSLTHVLISWSFNYDFVTNQPNWMDALWGLSHRTAWDGGFFGLISWSVPMLAGTLVYDLMQTGSLAASARRLFVWGCGLMLIAYAASCMTTLYDVREDNPVRVTHMIAPQSDAAKKNLKTIVDAEHKAAANAKAAAAKKAFQERTADMTADEKKKAEEEEKTRVAAEKIAAEKLKRARHFQTYDANHAASPVWPPFANAQGRSLTDLLAEPPFCPPPEVKDRKLNYWMMNKRLATQSFMVFATGFSVAGYALFILLCDLKGLTSNLFAMFGENPLAAYFLHHFVEELVHCITPKDSPAWWATTGLFIFFLITWLCVRHLKRSNIYIRL